MHEIKDKAVPAPAGAAGTWRGDAASPVRSGLTATRIGLTVSGDDQIEKFRLHEEIMQTPWSWQVAQGWNNIAGNYDRGVLASDKNLRRQIMRFCSYNSKDYPYATDYFQESKPVMRAMLDSNSYTIAKPFNIAGAMYCGGNSMWSDSSPDHAPTLYIRDIFVVRNRVQFNTYRQTAHDIEQAIGAAHVPNPPCATQKAYMLGNVYAPAINRRINEVYLFLGHTRQMIETMCTTGMRPDLGQYDAPKLFGFGGKGHGALGRGAYFTDQIDKAISYAPCPVCDVTGSCTCASNPINDAMRQVLLCRVVLGREHFVTNGSPLRHENHNNMVRANWGGQARVEGASNSPVPNTAHSVVGLKTYESGGSAFTALQHTANFDSNEYMVRNPGQVYPEYIINYTIASRRAN